MNERQLREFLFLAQQAKRKIDAYFDYYVIESIDEWNGFEAKNAEEIVKDFFQAAEAIRQYEEEEEEVKKIFQ